MKKVLILMLALLVCLTCVFAVGCSGGKVVKDGDTIIIGITDYPPMDYKEEGSDEWTGFDYELSKKVFEELGYNVEYKVIDWETKMVTLNAGTIDCIWNGMTVTEELLNNVLISNVYLDNQQYAVVKADVASQYTSKDSLIGKVVAVEGGSAAEDAIKDIAVADVKEASDQNGALTDVKLNQADVAIVDRALAKTWEAQNSDLVAIDLDFDVEEFGVAFRQSDSKLCWNVNKKLDELKKSGYIAGLAIKYGLPYDLI